VKLYTYALWLFYQGSINIPLVKGDNLEIVFYNFIVVRGDWNAGIVFMTGRVMYEGETIQ
jgi:hypothetical protein